MKQLIVAYGIPASGKTTFLKNVGSHNKLDIEREKNYDKIERLEKKLERLE